MSERQSLKDVKASVAPVGLHSHPQTGRRILKATKAVWKVLNVVPLIPGGPSDLSVLSYSLPV